MKTNNNCKTDNPDRRKAKAALDKGGEEIRKLKAATKPKEELELYEIHPLAAAVPEMSPERYEEFRTDVKARGGLTDPNITLYEGKILAGRHRDRVCRELGIPGAFRPYDGTDPAGFVISRNIMRRDLQLTDDQRVQLVYRIRGPELKAAAQKRKKARQFGAKAPNESHGDAESAFHHLTYSCRNTQLEYPNLSELDSIPRARYVTRGLWSIPQSNFTGIGRFFPI